MEVVKRVELDCIGYDVGVDVARQGDLALRWRKMLWVDGELVKAEPHRAVLRAGDDIDALMQAVNADLEAQGYGRMPDTDIELVKLQTEAVWTPAVLTAAAKLAEEAAAAQAAADEVRVTEEGFPK